MLKVSQTFLNIPVKNLTNSINFFKTLGFEFNPKFTDEKAGCMIINQNTYAMLITEEFFKTFTKKPISDYTNTTQFIMAIQVESKQKVEDLVNMAFATGATPSNDKFDYGWMYGWSFVDLDGHLWETMYIDEKGIPEKPTS